MNFKAIVTDIDGTLLNSDRDLSQRTIDTIKSLPADVPVILASSRMPKAMRHLQADLGILHWPLICYNGGYVLAYEGDQARVLHSTPIAPEIARATHEFARGSSLHVSLYRADDWYAPRDDQWAQREVHNTKVPVEIGDLGPVVTRWEVESYGPHKIMCMGEPEDIDAVNAFLAREFGAQLHLYRSRPTYLEIADRSISKATALQLLADETGLFQPAEVLAFGDNYNDTDMLELSGWGVAVENAKVEVRDAADEIVARSVDDGVAEKIESVFGGK